MCSWVILRSPPGVVHRHLAPAALTAIQDWAKPYAAPP